MFCPSGNAVNPSLGAPCRTSCSPGSRKGRTQTRSVGRFQFSGLSLALNLSATVRAVFSHGQPDPWRFRCPVSGAMVVPGGSCLAREGQTNSGQGWLERSRKAPPLHRVSDTEHRTPGDPGFWDPAGSFAPFRGQGPLPQGPLPQGWLQNRVSRRARAAIRRAGPSCLLPQPGRGPFGSRGSRFPGRRGRRGWRRRSVVSGPPSAGFPRGSPR